MLHSCQAQAQFVLQEGPDLPCPCTAPGAGPCFQARLCNRAKKELGRDSNPNLWSPQARRCLVGSAPKFRLSLWEVLCSEGQHFTWSHTSAPTSALTLELPLWLYAPR